jgi:hypothetical protein
MGWPRGARAPGFAWPARMARASSTPCGVSLDACQLCEDRQRKREDFVGDPDCQVEGLEARRLSRLLDGDDPPPVWETAIGIALGKRSCSRAVPHLAKGNKGGNRAA